MRIAVIGAGAIGSLFGGYLSHGGLDVSLIHRSNDRIKLLNEQGLKICGKRGDFLVQPKVYGDASPLGEVDVVLLCVKSYQTKQAVMQHSSLIGKNTQIISLQNGIGNIETISDLPHQGHVLGASTTMGAYLDEAGTVHHAGEGDTHLGDTHLGDTHLDDSKVPEGISEEVAELAKVFTNAGIKFTPVKSIQSILYTKLAINCAINPLTALLRVPNGAIEQLDILSDIGAKAVSEVAALAKAQNIDLDSQALIARMKEVAKLTEENRSSMLKDVLANRQTEIDAICGAVARLGKKYNVPTPVNNTLASLITALYLSMDARIY